MDVVALGLAKSDAARKMGFRTKRAAYSLGNAMTTAAAASEGTQRIDVELPVSTTRWRLHIRNWRASTGAVLTGAISFTGAWVGKHAMTASGANVGLGTGNFTAAPAQALGAFTSPADGGECVTPWVTTTAAQFAAYTPQLLSLGWTGAPSTIYRALGASAYYKDGTGTSATASQQTTTGFFTQGFSAFDAWIEYEFAGTQPVIFVAGDSLSAGYNTLETPTNTPFSRSWPSQFSLLSGMPVVNSGVSSLQASNITTATNGFWTRWGLGTGIFPDAAFIDLGSNDAASLTGGGAATYEANICTVMDILRGFGVGKLLLGTVTPRSFTVGALTAAASSGVTTLSVSANFPASSTLVIDYGNGTREQVVMTAAAPTGSGPYSIALTAATTQAHASGATIMAANEAYRRDGNAWLRKAPYGAHGVVDFDAALADPANLSALLAGVVGTPDGVHLNRDGYRRKAMAIPSRFVIPG